MKNMEIKWKNKHLWFIEKLLQKILRIAERCFSRKTSQPGICDRILYRNICERRSEFRWRYKSIEIAFTSKAIVKMCIQICFFSKAWYIVQTFWVSETTQKKSLQKHLKIGICWKNNKLSSCLMFYRVKLSR